MDIKPLSLNSVSNVGFGLLTPSAENRLFNSRYIEGQELNTALRLSTDEDFILNYEKNRFELSAVNYQYSFVFPDPKNKFPKIELMNAILDKMAEIKEKFSVLPSRKEKLSLKDYNIQKDIYES